MRGDHANALDRSLDIAATLEVRGYGAARRPAARAGAMSRHDVAFAASAPPCVAVALPHASPASLRSRLPR